MGDIHAIIDGVLVDIADRFLVSAPYDADGDRGWRSLERWTGTVYGTQMESTFTDIDLPGAPDGT